jgi:hypothetical protein
VLTSHIIVSVGLLGDVACLLAVAIWAATTDDEQLAAASHELLGMFSLFFGIPLSFATLITGVTLGVGTAWGVFRYPWVMGKLAIILSVILVGALVIGPAEAELVDGNLDARARVIAGACYDVVALVTATGLSVFKPGRRRLGRRRATLPNLEPA